MKSIIGHSRIIDFFTKVVDNAALSHAYCFVGLEQVGKCTVAEYLASKLLQVEENKLTSSPDFVFVGQEKDEKTDKTKKDISVKQIRILREQLAKKSYFGGYKVAIIDQAEKMNAEASNALLKTLEEPTGKTIIFLLTNDESKLPETILSRVQIINFSLVSNEELRKGLLDKEVENIDEIIGFSRGLPGLALDLSNDQEKFIAYKKEVKRFTDLFGIPFHEKLALVEELFGDKTDHIATRQNLSRILDIWQYELRDREVENKQKVFLQDQIYLAKEMLGKNIHPRLLVENILLNIN